MTANTVYEVFLALSPEEREKFVVLVKGQQTKSTFDFKSKRVKKEKFTKEAAIQYLLSSVFKPKG